MPVRNIHTEEPGVLGGCPGWQAPPRGRMDHEGRERQRLHAPAGVGEAQPGAHAQSPRRHQVSPRGAHRDADERRGRGELPPQPHAEVNQARTQALLSWVKKHWFKAERKNGSPQVA